MQSKTVTKAYLVLSAAFATISIPSAYMFGLSIPMRMGLDSLLDGTFFSGELFRFGLLLIGVSAFMRPLAAITFSALELPIKEKGTVSVSNWAKWIYFIAAWGILVFTVFAALGFFLDRALVFSFFLFLYFYTAVTMFFYSTLKAGTHAPKEFVGVRGYLIKSCQWRSYLNDQFLLVANLGLILAATATFGYLRTITLSLSHQYCIVADDETIEAAIVGRTERGLVVATPTDRDWTPITIPTGVPWISSTVFSFMTFESVTSIHWSCE